VKKWQEGIMKLNGNKAMLYDAIDRNRLLASKLVKQPPSEGDELDFEFYEVKPILLLAISKV
jgi:hypothetical protein